MNMEFFDILGSQRVVLRQIDESLLPLVHPEKQGRGLIIRALLGIRDRPPANTVRDLAAHGGAEQLISQVYRGDIGIGCATQKSAGILVFCAQNRNG